MAFYYGGKDETGRLGQRIVNDTIDQDRIYEVVKNCTTPSIGELRFLLVPNLDDAVYSCFSTSGDTYVLKDRDGFDGWVYPDGKKFRKTDFPLAYDEFGDGVSDFFNVPVLSDFIRFNVGQNKDNPTERIPFQNYIQDHDHTITTKTTTSEEIVEDCFQMYVTNGYSSDGNLFNKEDPKDTIRVHNKAQYLEHKDVLGKYCPGFHAGGVDSGNKVAKIDVKVGGSVELTGAKTDSAGSDEREIYPTFNYIPVMIYIGGVS